MERKPLKEYFDKILDRCAEDCEVGYDDPIEQEYCPETNFFYFEEDGYLIEGSFEIIGKYGVSGDGYWEPREEYLTNVKVLKVEIDTASWTDETSDVEVDVPQEEIDQLISEIESYLPEMVEF